MESAMNLYQNSIQFTLILPLVFLLPAMALAQQEQNDDKPAVQQQAGKSFILQFHAPGTIDAQQAKARSLIRLDYPLDEETRKKLQGQAIRFHTGSDGEHYLEILHPDSADLIRYHTIEAAAGKVQAQSSEADLLAVFREHRAQTAEKQMNELPLRILTRSASDNRLEVIVENRTDRPMTNLVMAPNHLPGEWTTIPDRHTAEAIPAYGSDIFTFRLETPGGAGAEMVGFQLQTNEVVFPWSARIQPSANEGERIPDTFKLHGNYPNPFNPATTISYSLPEAMEVSVQIYNLLGQRVATLVNHRQSAGTHNVVWDASAAASGTYIYRVIGIGESGMRVFDERKLTLIK